MTPALQLKCLKNSDVHGCWYPPSLGVYVGSNWVVFQLFLGCPVQAQL